jgi:hypothetical protein
MQSQLVPRGTESPSATIESICGVSVVVAVTSDRDDDVEQPAAAQPSAISPASAQHSRRDPMPQV